ncbi:MAG: undecaprenyl-diphosphate phosphatase, partial [Planctomycetaceae bacterium]|nr:undecaprenyl-diphosphate phosphatase [Planctomycetaceae bacterium]
NFEASSLTLNIALHFGTLISILVVFWKRIWLLLTSDRRVIPLLILATIPAVIAKVLISKTVGDDAIFENSLLAGICFPITGLLLLWCSNRSGETHCRDLSWIKAALIGLMQAVAILPGISRSGSTICAGLLCGLKRGEAATFSFLMAIPVIGGGALLEFRDLMKQQASNSPEVISSHGLILLLMGVIVSCIVGILTLKLLIRWLHEGKLKYFAWWLFLIGPVVIVWRLFFA